MKNRKLVVLPLIAVVAIFVLSAYFYKSSQTQRSVVNSSQVHSAPYIRKESIKLGKNNSNVTVVEFMDPFCVACARFQPIMKRILKEYGDEIQVTIRYVNHQKNIPEVIRILEASREQDLYEETLDAVLSSQNVWGNYKNLKPNLIWNYVVQIPNINIEKLREDMKNTKIEEVLSQDTKDAIALGITGTPTILVNGKKLEKLSYKDLNNLIESEIFK